MSATALAIKSVIKANEDLLANDRWKRATYAPSNRTPVDRDLRGPDDQRYNRERAGTALDADDIDRLLATSSPEKIKAAYKRVFNTTNSFDMEKNLAKVFHSDNSVANNIAIKYFKREIENKVTGFDSDASELDGQIDYSISQCTLGDLDFDLDDIISAKQIISRMYVELANKFPSRKDDAQKLLTMFLVSSGYDKFFDDEPKNSKYQLLHLKEIYSWMSQLDKMQDSDNQRSNVPDSQAKPYWARINKIKMVSRVDNHFYEKVTKFIEERAKALTGEDGYRSRGESIELTPILKANAVPSRPTSIVRTSR